MSALQKENEVAQVQGRLGAKMVVLAKAIEVVEKAIEVVAQHKFKGDWAREDGRRGDEVHEGYGQGAGNRICFGGVLQVWPRSRQPQYFWRSAPSLVEKLAETARLLAESASMWQVWAQAGQQFHYG